MIYYKLKNKVNKALGINRNEIMNLGLEYQLDACRLINMSEDLSCMGFRSLEVSKNIQKSRPSQCVNDYVDKIKDVASSLREDARIIYLQLTPGYQKDWARYIFSAIQEKTRINRIALANKVIIAGYKSLDKYKSSTKK